MDKEKQKKKNLASFILSIIGVCLLLAFFTFWIIGFIMCESVFGGIFDSYFNVLIINSFIVGIAVLLLIWGAVLTFTNKDKGAVISVFGLNFVCIEFILNTFFMFNTLLRGAIISIILNISLFVAVIVLIVSLCLAQKPAKFKLFATCLIIACISGVYWTSYAVFGALGIVYTVWFAFFGLGGALVATFGGLAEIKGKDSFGTILFSLLLEIGQFIVVCLICGKVGVLLGVGGAATILIGGMLVTDSRKNGFILIAFGIIFLLTLLGYLFFLGKQLDGSALTTGTLLLSAMATIFAVVLLFSQAMRIRRASETLQI